MLTVDDIFDSGGLIAAAKDNYEQRREQMTMAQAVYEAFLNENHLAVEAGTGVGKSFAYLVPAILIQQHQTQKPSDDEDAPIRRVVISTHTISLQEQIIEKDIPFLQRVIPFEFNAVLMKGRNNYLCLRRLARALEKGNAFFAEESGELERITAWCRNSEDGSKSDSALSPEPDSRIWNEICCERGNCLGRKCAHYEACFYRKAYRRVSNAQILVVNHALLFSDLAVRSSGGHVLPPYYYLVIDEGHTVEQTVADHFGIAVSQASVEYHLNRLYNQKNKHGLLSGLKKADSGTVHAAEQAVAKCFYDSDTFFNSVAEWLLKDSKSGQRRVHSPNVVNNPLSGSLRRIAQKLRDMTSKSENFEEDAELQSAKDRILAVAGEIEHWLAQDLDDKSVYWAESNFSARGRNRVEIYSSPLDVGSLLRETLFEPMPSVVLTSATLSTAGRQPFAYFKSQIGIPDIKTLHLGSPFDYKEQATLVIAGNAPPPTSREEVLRPFYEKAIKKYLKETNGGAFVLFTSYTVLNQTANDLTAWLAERGFPLFVQGNGMPRSEMVHQFQKAGNGVLFGTDSFWQGVDVPGNALRNVIITKLPFEVPTKPLVEAKSEAIEERGGNSFFEYSLPQAVLKFKQGFGRLIRTRNDKGLVVILDSRIDTKSYGKDFINALPPCTIRRE